MKKKIVSVLIGAALVGTVGLATGCGHKHAYSDSWSSDEYYHWHTATCDHASEEADKALHTWDNGTVTENADGSILNLKCTVCGKEKSQTQSTLSFEEKDDGYVFVGYDGELTSEFTVPTTYNSKPVVAIGDYAFTSSDIVSVRLPASVKSIGKNAFANCSKLSSVYVGDDQTASNVMIFNGDVKGLSGIDVDDTAFDDSGIATLTIDSVKNDTSTVVPVNVVKKPANATKLKITAAVNSVTDIRAVTEIDLDKDGIETTADFGTYGLFQNINVEFLDKDGKAVVSSVVDGVSVTASHYNLALLNASYPVLVFSLTMKDRQDHPTFVALERTDAYDWSKLPDNVFKMPFDTNFNVTVNKAFHHLRAGLSSYIKTLYSLDNTSTFTLFTVDNYPELILQMLVANKIPESNWSAVMLSDGTGTAYYLNDTFATADNPQAKYAEMSANWKDLCARVKQNGYENYDVLNHTTYPSAANNPSSILARYPYVIAKEQDNVSWWVNRLRTTENLAALNSKDSAFANDVVNLVASTSFYTNNLLSALSEKQATEFKALYHFSNDMFVDAYENEKKIMVILGTSAGDEGNFLEYMKLTMDLYGDGYEYYYKGHPGWPTSSAPARQTALAALEEAGYVIHELDNAIAAEVIFFFEPSCYISGWASTTFESVEDDSKACMIFNQPSTTTESSVAKYKDMLDRFVTKLADGTATYEGISLNSAHSYMLIEYNNTAKYPAQVAEYNKHEIAIYDATDGVIAYYKNDGGTYKAVNADGSNITPSL